MTGLSARNLKYMRAFAAAWSDAEFVQRVVAQLPWGHNVSLLDAVKSAEQRAWYAGQAIEHGWSRSVLIHQIERDLFAANHPRYPFRLIPSSAPFPRTKSTASLTARTARYPTSPHIVLAICIVHACPRLSRLQYPLKRSEPAPKSMS
jgi:hypothetical protein